MDAFRDAYERHHSAVYRFALFLTGDAALADDLAADTFVRAWLARDRIRQSSVRAYLLTITRNLHRDHRRANRPLLVPLDEGTTDQQPGTDARVEHRSDLLNLRRRLRHVAPGDRHALLLYAFQEKSYGEIAGVLGISTGAVKSRIARAREALRTPHPVTGNGDTSS